MIRRALIIAFGVCCVYAGMVSLLPDTLRRRGSTTHQNNCVRVEQLIHSRNIPENIILGTSLFDMLQPEMLGPEFGSLALAGGSARTGLEILGRSQLRPKRVFLETNFLPKSPDPELLGYLYDQPMSALRGGIPLLRQSHQPINLLFSLLLRNRTASEIVAIPAQVEIALRHHAALYSIPAGTDSLELEEVRQRVDALQSRGIEVILVELPTHPTLENSIRSTALRSAVESVFPPVKWTWIRGDPKKHYTTTDGLHLVTADARDFADSVRAVAQLPPVNK
jgi:hypothetical protein